MPVHSANAIWYGGLKDGKGNMNTESGALNTSYTVGTRFGDDKNGSNPEELIGAALAGCFSMFLGGVLEKAGSPAKHLMTEARVHLDKNDSGPYISKIELKLEGDVPGMSEADFDKYAREAKENCPVSKALRGTAEVTLTPLLKR